MDFANVTLVSDDGESVGMMEGWDERRLDFTYVTLVCGDNKEVRMMEG